MRPYVPFFAVCKCQSIWEVYNVLTSRYCDYLITCKKHQFIKTSFLC